ncbi:MAG TPA: PAS domain-containing protein [Actinomycetota bacterium]|nr:PAS domain-containing protein [Actinomycetota bacterium]
MPETHPAKSPSAEGLFESPEALFRALVEQVPAVVYIDSDDQRPDSLYMSPQSERVFGYSPSAYVAQPELWRDNTHPEDRPVVADAWAAARANGEAFACEYRVRHRAGRWLWVRDEAVPVRGGGGEIQAWQGVLHDVTARKETEQALREAEEKYRALVENVPAVVYLVAPDDDRRTLYVSPQVERALGYPREEWLDQPDIWMELLHPDDREQTLAAHDAANETGQPWSREYRLIASDGRAVWFRDVATLVRDLDGRALHWQGVQLDITELKRVEEELRRARDDLELRVLLRTHELEEANEMMALEIAERRRAEDELRATERKYRMMAEQIPAVTYVWHVDQEAGQIDYTSPQIERLLGYTPGEWGTADLWLSRLHPDDRTRVMADTLRSQTTGESFSAEARYLAKDGRIVWLLDEAVLLERDGAGLPKTFHGVLVDITARKEAEASARAAQSKATIAEARYRTLVEQIPAMTFIEMRSPDDPRSIHLTFASPQTEPILGYTPQELIDDPGHFARMLHPDDRDRVLAVNEHSERTGEPVDQEYRVVAKDGRVVWIHCQAVLVTDESGAPRFWHTVALDITARKEAEENLRELEGRYQAMLGQLGPDPDRA